MNRVGSRSQTGSEAAGLQLRDVSIISVGMRLETQVKIGNV